MTNENALRDTPMGNCIASVLGFPGFYESVLSEALDNAERNMVEGLIENYDLPDEPNPYEACYDASTYSIGFNKVARAYVDWLNHVLADTGIVLAYKSMESPREYNYSTDVLFVTINDTELLAKLTDPGYLRVCIEEHFTSRPGFYSFYSNNAEDWRAKPLADWDHNELGTLLTAYLRQVAEDKNIDQHDMLDWLEEAFDDAIDEQTDFDKLYAALRIEP